MRMIMKKIISAILIIVVIGIFLQLYYVYDNQVLTLPKQYKIPIYNALKEWKYLKDDIYEYEFVAVSSRVYDIKETDDEVKVYGHFCQTQYREHILDELEETNEFDYNSSMYCGEMIFTLKRNNETYEVTDIWTLTSLSDLPIPIEKMIKFPIKTWSRIIINDRRYCDELSDECIKQVKDYLKNR